MSQQLRTTTRSAAGPYGFTISFGGSIALAVHGLHSPDLARTLALMAGAVIAFVLLEALARPGDASAALPVAQPPMLGNAHIPSAGAAIMSTWGIAQVLPADAAWPVIGFASTFVYFSVTSAQRAALAALQSHRRRTPRTRPAARNPRR